MVITTDDLIMIIGFILTTVCVICLVTTWCLLPHWRTLHNYISINYIIIGSLFLCSDIAFHFSNDEYSDIFFILSDNLYLIMISWSLCSSFVAYLKLVLLHTGKMSHEKRNATIFTYSTVIVVDTVTLFIKHIVNHNSKDFLYTLLPSLFIMTGIMAVFIRVSVSVMSCCKKSMSTRNFKHVVSLIGVALVCDTGNTIAYVILLFGYPNNIFMSIWLSLRYIPQSLFVLLNKSTREKWKRYCRTRNQMANVIEL